MLVLITNVRFSSELTCHLRSTLLWPLTGCLRGLATKWLQGVCCRVWDWQILHANWARSLCKILVLKIRTSCSNAASSSLNLLYLLVTDCIPDLVETEWFGTVSALKCKTRRSGLQWPLVWNTVQDIPSCFIIWGYLEPYASGYLAEWFHAHICRRHLSDRLDSVLDLWPFPG